MFVLPSVLRIVRDIIGFIILWIIVSIPVYFAAKLVTGGRAHFGQAMLATLVGPIVFAIVLAIGYFVAASIFSGLGLLALLIAFLAWIWVYKATFGTGWLQAFGIAIISVIVGIILIAILELAGLMIRNVLIPNLVIVLQFALLIR